ncbi:protein kinase domain-containing protein [Nocardia sp. CA-145437]|uniref:serine/threonine-protein kinase n=1 Tax=Nocardia sp. CA-145437 TaxID=3239980 RepID=UPI003D95A91E
MRRERGDVLGPLLPGDPGRIGPFVLHGRLGAGGMGVVYQGFGPDGAVVAIKVPKPELAHDREFRARFRHEVAAARRVHGEFVAEVVDADVDASRPWMASAFVSGEPLQDVVARRGPLTGNALDEFTSGLAQAIAAVHRAGVVHRDLKPANILLTLDGPKIIDFGLAYTADSTRITAPGVVIGTIAWMAPEQFGVGDAGAPIDIFAWGTCVAFAATGRIPFNGDSVPKVMVRIVRGTPDLDGLPGKYRRMLAVSLSKDPELRPTAEDLVTAFARPDPPRRPRPVTPSGHARIDAIPSDSEPTERADSWLTYLTRTDLPDTVAVSHPTVANSDRDTDPTVVQPDSQPKASDPDATQPAPDPTVIAPDPTVIAPGPTVVAPGPTVIAPDPTVIAPGPTVVAPGPTVAAPGPTVVVPGPTIVARPDRAALDDDDPSQPVSSQRLRPTHAPDRVGAASRRRARRSRVPTYLPLAWMSLIPPLGLLFGPAALIQATRARVYARRAYAEPPRRTRLATAVGVAGLLVGMLSVLVALQLLGGR